MKGRIAADGRIEEKNFLRRSRDRQPYFLLSLWWQKFDGGLLKIPLRGTIGATDKQRSCSGGFFFCDQGCQEEQKAHSFVV